MGFFSGPVIIASLLFCYFSVVIFRVDGKCGTQMWWCTWGAVCGLFYGVSKTHCNWVVCHIESNSLYPWAKGLSSMLSLKKCTVCSASHNNEETHLFYSLLTTHNLNEANIGRNVTGCPRVIIYPGQNLFGSKLTVQQ